MGSKDMGGYGGLQVCSGPSVYMNLSVLIGTLPIDSRVKKFCEQLRCNKKRNKKLLKLLIQRLMHLEVCNI